MHLRCLAQFQSLFCGWRNCGNIPSPHDDWQRKTSPDPSGPRRSEGRPYGVVAVRNGLKIQVRWSSFEHLETSLGSFLSATRCLLKLMLGLHWVQSSQEIYLQYLQPPLRSELMFRFQVLIKRHDGIGCFLHPSTRSTWLTIFFLAVLQVFHVFQWEAMFLPMLPMVSKFKWHLPRFFARTGAHYHASRLQHSGRNQMVRSFPGHDPEHKEQLSHNRWFLTSSWYCKKAVPGRFTCCMHVETI